MKWLAIWYLLASLATFAAFAIDKSCARRGFWRTRERTLHAWSLAGGFAGAIVAMLVLRHKNRKIVFWGVNLAIAAVHAVAVVLLLR
jgi:uncharacterized membrane protein YsdA (DUF1294 family)